MVIQVALRNTDVHYGVTKAFSLELTATQILFPKFVCYFVNTVMNIETLRAVIAQAV
jgi:hypothetical protein